jgi:hypothetical protein
MSEKRQRLERERKDLQERLSKIERELAGIPAEKNRRRIDVAPSPALRHSRSLREVVLDQLHAIGSMVYSQTISQVFRAQFDRDLPSTRFGTLSSDEQKAFDAGRAKAVSLCHGVTYDRGEAIKRLWARSDWPLEKRIVAPTTGRVLFLKIAAWLNTLAETPPAAWARRDLLEYLAADCARDLGFNVRKGDRHFADWRAAAEDELTKAEPEDFQRRQEAAARLLARLRPRELHFGASEGLVVLPGSRGDWRRIE